MKVYLKEHFEEIFSAELQLENENKINSKVLLLHFDLKIKEKKMK